ncbi:transcription termination factor MTERF9, chloroplastic-like [Impatiens glandulifera]|uniref:transcription termination factor MTERF9, chloroplastic-like n=1 Tax=Impatiens glandulifera TaxID=253017 RepID=UPI001FB10DD6|nr:transcription termination factor MTERF9, chloroplastic-like [Impatiens glandulifera]
MTKYIYKSIISNSLMKNLNQSTFFRHHISFSNTNFSTSASSPSRSVNRVIAAEYLNTHHNFPPEFKSKLSSIYRSIDPDKCDSIISIFKNNGFSQTDLERIVCRKPSIVAASPNKTVEPKIKLFLDSGFSPAETADLIVIDPGIWSRSTDHLSSTIAKLKEIFDYDTSRVHMFLKIGRFPSTCLEKYLIPNIKLLQSFGIETEQIQRYIPKSPRHFCSRTVKMMELVKKAEGLGISRNGKMLLPTMRTLSSLSKGSWERKLRVFRGLGFNEDEIAHMLKRMPLVISVSEGKIKDITEFLVSSGEANVSTIARYPFVLMFSLEKRLKPRFQVLQALKSKRLIDEKHTLLTVCKLTDAYFVSKFCVLLPQSEDGTLLCS